jgi:hypothetical protein
MFAAMRAGLPEVITNDEARNRDFHALLPIVKKFTESE